MSGIYNITIEQGATFEESYVWKDGTGTAVNLTGYTPHMQVRDRDDQILLDVSTYLTIPTPANGTVTLLIPAATTGAITAWRSGKYDLKLVSSGFTKRLLEGEVSVTPQETQ